MKYDPGAEPPAGSRGDAQGSAAKYAKAKEEMVGFIQQGLEFEEAFEMAVLGNLGSLLPEDGEPSP